MSELQLSEQLIQAVQAALISHDPETKDEGVLVQYLAAIIGVTVGKQSIPNKEKKEFIEHLYAFSNHVLEDVTKDQPQAASPPPQEAFGIWKPGDK